MTTGPVVETTAPAAQAPGPTAETKNLRSRLAIIWAVAFGLLVVAFAATVIALNASVFAASGFVSAYLQSLERQDLAAIMAMPGVEADADASDALIRRDALGTLSEVEIVDDDDRGGGEHHVTVAYRVGGEGGRTTFIVQHTGPHMGVFNAWEFVESPLAVIEVVPQHAVEFEVNGIPVIAAEGAGVANAYQVLIPGAYTFRHESKFLESEETTVTVTATHRVAEFELEVAASSEFEDAVEDELAAYLDRCAAEKELQPTGCPFGKVITNRIDSEPLWSIDDYPAVEIVPGEEVGTWLVTPTIGVARIDVDVRSLFDGSVTPLSEAIPFTVSYLVTFTADNGLVLTPR